ncbi:DNA polymerase III subunit beta [Candidatus Hepatincolaceae symbiont of Richtersius coronifer]
MKFVINSTHLLKALDNVQGVVDKKHITPILSNIRISSESQKLLINATDMDLDIIEVLDAEIIEAGSTTAPAYLMFETLKRLPANTPIEFALVNEQLTMKCGKFKSNLNCLPVEDFPIIQTNDLPNSFQVSTASFKRLLEKTRFAVSLDETRYYLNGIYLHTTNDSQDNKVLRAVATDGHRLALVDMSSPENAEIKEGVIIPKKTVDELYRLIDKLEDKEMQIASSNTRISFKFNKVILTSKLIEGNFPNYTKVIPVGNDKILEVNRHDFVNAINLISTYSDEKLKAIKIEISDKKMNLTAHKVDGVAEQELDLFHSIDNMEICFNAKYINDICALVKTDNLVMHLSSSFTPALIKKEDGEDEIFVIMPIRI